MKSRVIDHLYSEFTTGLHCIWFRAWSRNFYAIFNFHNGNLPEPQTYCYSQEQL